MPTKIKWNKIIYSRLSHSYDNNNKWKIWKHCIYEFSTAARARRSKELSKKSNCGYWIVKSVILYWKWMSKDDLYIFLYLFTHKLWQFIGSKTSVLPPSVLRFEDYIKLSVVLNFPDIILRLYVSRLSQELQNLLSVATCGTDCFTLS